MTKNLLANILTIIIIFVLLSLLSACIHDNAYTQTIKAGDFQKLQEYLKKQDINKPIFRGDITFLMLAASEGNIRMVQYLVEQGADVNQERKERYGAVTPLRYAITKGNIAIVNYLIEQGADVLHKNDAGWTALMTAAGGGNLEITTALIEAGSDVFAKTESGVSAIDIASKNSHYNVFFYLSDFYGYNVQKNNLTTTKEL